MDPKTEEAIHQERHVRIICIGAGASGLCFAYKLQRSFRNFSLVIYEKSPDVSGTWHENRYPGCACDIPAHNYTYSFEPKADFSSTYASSKQIKEYFVEFCGKHGLMKYINTCHRVNDARWDEADHKWNVIVADLKFTREFHDSCDILINAGGYLNNWAWPNIPGLEEFEGRLLHTANWDSEVILKGKKVGLIGNGSSAIQILPHIQPDVDRLTNFIRSPRWIFPSISGDQEDYTEREIDHFITDPTALLNLRKKNESFANSVFSLYLRDSLLQKQIKAKLTLEMQRELGNYKTEKLIPTHSVGCQRITPSTKYLKALTADNVDIVHEGVSAFTKRGCKSDTGQDHLLDIIICATGFDTSHKPQFPIIGSGGNNLQDVWAQQPMSYFGIAISGFPNLLTLLGPYSPISNGPTLCGMEAQVDHILRMVDRFQTENILSFCPKSDTIEDFAEYVQGFMPSTVWTEGCRSSFKNHTTHGRLPTIWPGSTLHYLEALNDLRADDLDIKYDGNRFAWLGNGISRTEVDTTCDLGYYIRNADDGPFASRSRRREVFSKSGSQPTRELHRLYRPVTP